MTSAYPQGDFAKSHFWRASKKIGEIVGPMAFSPSLNAQKY
jgi:hypothetical protein